MTPMIPGEPATADVLEKTTPRYSFALKDDQGNALPAASLTTLTLTLYVVKSDGIVSYIRNNQNVLNTNNVTINSSGAGVWSIQIGDTTILEAGIPVERHIALWQWTWSSGTKAGKHELVLSVKNLVGVN